MAGRALLVEDGESRIALAAVRALHVAGWTVGVAAPYRSMAMLSRATTARHVAPVPGDGIAPFVAAVAAAVEDGAYEIVFGVGDAELLALSAYRDAFTARVPYPEHSAVLAAVDKAGLTVAATAVGIRSPRVLAPDELTGERGPFVVKPRLNGQVGHLGTSKIEARVVPPPRPRCCGASRCGWPAATRLCRRRSTVSCWRWCCC